MWQYDNEPKYNSIIIVKNSLKMDKALLSKFVDSYADFPEEGVLFRDLSPLFGNPKLLNKLIEEMSNVDFCKNAEAILAVDARGFLFGSMISMKLNKPMVLARKPGKLPGELISRSYSLEYGKNSLSLQKQSKNMSLLQLLTT